MRRLALLGLLCLAAISLTDAGALAAQPRIERIVSLAPSITEILFAIGAQDLLVGVSAQCDSPVAAKLKPRVGDFNRPDLAKVVASKPAVVLFAEYVRPADLDAVRREGLRAEVLPARDLADLVRTVRRLGEITARSAAAEILASGIEREVADVAARLIAIPEARRPRVYVEVDGPQKLYAVGPGSFMGDLVRAAGGRNAFDDGPAPYFPVSDEEVLRRNPEVILIDHPFQYKVGLAHRRGWGTMAAVVSERVYDGTDFDIILLNRPGPRIAVALRQLAHLLHPNAFAAAPREEKRL